MKNIAIIGAGSFGYNLAVKLAHEGSEVLVIDIDKDRIEPLKLLVPKVVIADASKKETLEELGLADFDVVVVSLGDHLEASIMTILFLKQLKVKRIIAKADNEDYGRAMELVGANEIIFPEKSVATNLAKTLLFGNVLEYFMLSDGYSIMEIAVPEYFLGKTLIELDFRNKHQLNIIAIKNSLTTNMTVIIPGDYSFQPDDSIIVIGENNNLKKFKQL